MNYISNVQWWATPEPSYSAWAVIENRTFIFRCDRDGTNARNIRERMEGPKYPLGFKTVQLTGVRAAKIAPELQTMMQEHLLAEHGRPRGRVFG